VQIFNLLIVPGVSDNGVLSAALAFAERKQAFVIMDPPANCGADQNVAVPANDMDAVFKSGVIPLSANGALYFPYLKTSNPLNGNAMNLPPSGFVAGVFARIDTRRGVWKAPAGLEALVNNTTGVVDSGRMTDPRQGVLNLDGINCLRTFPGIGTVVFGARTLVSANPSFQDNMYVPVRRMTLFIEQTLLMNLRWVVFEPNDEPLWIAIRMTIENFMLSLFNQGALQGKKPSEAFQVKCDSTTTTPDDQATGIVNIVVAFAPLKPAEFVIIKIAHLAGQTQT
jgi:phage tail sheath protein FI